jgi:hypothetical protein
MFLDGTTLRKRRLPAIGLDDRDVPLFDLFRGGHCTPFVARAFHICENVGEAGHEIPNLTDMRCLIRDRRHPLQRPRVVPDTVVAVSTDQLNGLVGVPRCSVHRVNRSPPPSKEMREPS